MFLASCTVFYIQFDFFFGPRDSIVQFLREINDALSPSLSRFMLLNMYSGFLFHHAIKLQLCAS